MDLRKLKTLVDLVSESNISELEITEADGKVRIVKADPGALRPQGAWIPAPAMMAPMVAPAAPAGVSAQAAVATAPKAAEPPESGHVIRSPMVGTFYRAPAPDADPYVEVGAQIEVGQTVCIVEAMKLMNEIESDVKGRIVQILVENAQPVEFGQKLFLVDPS